MKIMCTFGNHSWNGCRCSLCGKQRDQDHNWDQCVCTVCGRTRHEYKEISREAVEGGGCKWSLSDPCIGPYCGTPCDSYYEGREGSYIITMKCERCGSTYTEKRTANDVNNAWKP